MSAIVSDISSFSGRLDRPEPADIVFLPDKPFLYPWMTVKQSFDLFESRHLDFRRGVASEIVNGFGLGERERVGQCSKGMSERLHLALVIARAAPFYVLDEPLASVDPFTRDFLIGMIRTKRAPGSTVLLSTHLINDVESLFDDVMVISDGRLLHYGPVSDLKRDTDQSLEDAFKQMVAAHV